MSQTSHKNRSTDLNWFDAAYPEIGHGSLVTDIEIENRPAGIQIPLKGHGATLKKIFAIRRTADKHESLLELTDLYAENIQQPTVPCLIDPEALMINLELCKWCTLKKSCENHQSKQTHRIGISARSGYGTKTGIRTDIKTLLKWFESKEYIQKTDIPGMIFSKGEDPFKPGFGRKGNRNLLLIPLDEVQDDSNSKLNHWAHVFYSEILERSLSVSEAILIDYLPTTKSDFSLSGKSYKTLGELKAFFDNCNVSNGLNFTRFSSKINSSLAVNIDESKEQNLLYNQLSNNLNEFERSGLIGVVEHTSQEKYNPDDVPQITKLLWEFYKSLQKNKSMPDHFELVKLREHCILLSNGGKEMNIPSRYQVIRICKVNQIKHNWLLIDSEKMTRLNNNNNKNDKTQMPRQWLEQKSSPPKLLQEWLSHPPGFKRMRSQIRPQFDLKHWNVNRKNLNQLKNGTVLTNWFSGWEFFSAYAMNTQFRNIKSSEVTPGWDVKFSDLDGIFRALFFQHMEQYGQGGRLNEMHFEFHKPSHTRQHPREILIHLGKQKRFQSLVKFLTDPDGTDYAKNMNTQELQFISPETSDEVEQSVWVFRKQVWKNMTRPEDDAIQDRWFEHKIDGREVEMQFIRKRKLLEVLNWEPSQELRQFTSSRSIWTSPKVSQVFDTDNTQSRELCEIIRNRINQEGLDGVVFFAFNDELDSIRKMVGEENFVEIFQLNSSVIYCWNPHPTVSDFSPNFLNHGKLEW